MTVIIRDPVMYPGAHSEIVFADSAGGLVQPVTDADLDALLLQIAKRRGVQKIAYGLDADDARDLRTLISERLSAELVIACRVVRVPQEPSRRTPRRLPDLSEGT